MLVDRPAPVRADGKAARLDDRVERQPEGVHPALGPCIPPPDRGDVGLVPDPVHRPLVRVDLRLAELREVRELERLPVRPRVEVRRRRRELGRVREDPRPEARPGLPRPLGQRSTGRGRRTGDAGGRRSPARGTVPCAIGTPAGSRGARGSRGRGVRVSSAAPPRRSRSSFRRAWRRSGRGEDAAEDEGVLQVGEGHGRRLGRGGALRQADGIGVHRLEP